jgi:hypothetical protein
LPPLCLRHTNKKGPMSLRHRAFRAFRPPERPSVTSAEYGRGYSRRAWYLVALNILCLCVLGSNSAVKTSWKSRFLQNPEDRQNVPASVGVAGAHLLDAGRGQKFTRIFRGLTLALDSSRGAAFIPAASRNAEPCGLGSGGPTAIASKSSAVFPAG